MRAVLYRFRSELRTRWRVWVVLAALVGSIAGTSVLLLGGSRRTGSAYARFAEAQHAFDVGVVVSCRPGEPPPDRAEPGCHEAVAKLPAVERATTASSFPAFIETEDGRSLQPEDSDACYSGPGDVETVFDAAGRFGTTINRNRLVAGRAARPEAAGEVVISAETARRMHIGPGDQLRIRLFGGADCGDDSAKWRAPQRVRVVGVQLSPGEVRPPSGYYFQWVAVTPAFVRDAGIVPDRHDYLVVRLRRGATPDVLQAQGHKAGYEIGIVVAQAESARAVERAIRPNEASLAILAALTALAAAIVLGQILVRQASAESVDDGVLSALGMNARERIVLVALRAGFVGLVAAGVAVVLAVAASPMMPIGLARRVEPSRGFSADALVLGFGAMVTFIFVVVVSAGWAARPRRNRHRIMRSRHQAIVGAASRAGFSPAALSGTRFALERGAGSTAVPVVSAFAGLSIAVVAVVGALTFGSSLTHLRQTARLSGWNWDLVLAPAELDEASPEAVAVARTRAEHALDRSDVADLASGTIWPPFEGLKLGPDRRDAGGFMAFDGTARFGPSVITGRKPTAPDEILLGPKTLATLGLRIGDEIDVFGRVGEWGQPGKETSTRMRIVGTGVMPLSESLGRGATLTVDGLRRLSPGVVGRAWFVRLEPGASRKSVIKAFAAEFPEESRDSVAPFEGSSVENPSLNLAQIGSVPALFALIMGVMAAAVLAHVLGVAARARRRDLAILRVLGFSRRQTLSAIAVQSTIYVTGALAVGIPGGAVLGRSAWLAYAANLGAVPEAAIPVGAFAAVAAVALVLAGLISIGPATRIARTRPAAVLRTE